MEGEMKSALTTWILLSTLLVGCSEDESSNLADATTGTAGTTADLTSVTDMASGSPANTPEAARDLIAMTSRPSDLGDTPAVNLPEVGWWQYQDGQMVTDNTCGTYAFFDRDRSFWVSLAENNAFVIEQGDPWGDIVCFISGDQFTCPERGSGEEAIPNTDATLRYTVAVDGTLSATDRFSGTQTIVVTCEGTNCALSALIGIESFPCQWSVPFNASLVFALPGR